jgi:hypothetical protein
MSVYRIWWREDTEAGRYARWVIASGLEQAIGRFLRDQAPKAAVRNGYEDVVSCREYGGDHRTRLYGVRIEEGKVKVREIALPPFPDLDKSIKKAVAAISKIIDRGKKSHA